jgi:hypothetical protein
MPTLVIGFTASPGPESTAAQSPERQHHRPAISKGWKYASSDPDFATIAASRGTKAPAIPRA